MENGSGRSCMRSDVELRRSLESLRENAAYAEWYLSYSNVTSFIIGKAPQSPGIQRSHTLRTCDTQVGIDPDCFSEEPSLPLLLFLSSSLEQCSISRR